MGKKKLKKTSIPTTFVGGINQDLNDNSDNNENDLGHDDELIDDDNE